MDHAVTLSLDGASDADVRAVWQMVDEKTPAALVEAAFEMLDKRSPVALRPR